MARRKKMIPLKEEEIRKVVRKGYAKIVSSRGSCCTPAASCCGGANTARDMSKRIGYTDDELETVPEGANLGLGCGNPVALASLRGGETVLDLGAGAGFDCFLASNKVGRNGKVIGVDMTPEMVEKARDNAKKGNYSNVEFRLGEIENLPAADNSVDAVISNCVINLVPNKDRVFAETFRVLRPGGRIMISDIVLLKELPDSIRNSVEAYIGCLSGAIMKGKYVEAIEAAGFRDVKIIDETPFPVDLMANDPTGKTIIEDSEISAADLKDMANSVVSVKVNAIKPQKPV
jgi:arsenite methyltransferase